MLATYQVPLGFSEAKLTFTGERLELADFDALLEYIELFKKQHERKLNGTLKVPVVPQTRSYPAKAFRTKTVK